MEYIDWAPVYERIRREFGFEMDRETRAAEVLDRLLPDRWRVEGLGRVGRRLRGRDVVIVGLAPRAGAPPVWRLPRTDPPTAIVAADGAAQRCLSAGLVPDVIVTDLDGPVPAEVEANARGSLVILHAHGDNVPALEAWVPEFSGEVAGAWAGRPTSTLLDVGGFTDGDRAACLAQHVGARRILLWGFAFDRVEEGSEVEAARKLAKLRWARTVLDLLARGPVPLLTWQLDGTTVPYAPGAAPGGIAEKSTQ